MDFSHQSIILKRSHHFVVKNPTRAIMPVVYRLSSAYTQFGMEFDDRTKRRHWRPLKTFAIYVDGGREFRFHIGQYDEFMRMLHDAHVDQSSYEIVEEPDFEADYIEIERTEGWDLYPEQKEAEAFVLEPGRDNASSMIEIQMGSGKTKIACSAVSKIGKRFAVMVIGGYTDKWVADISSNLKIDKSEIAVIKGSDSLQRCTNYPGSGLTIPKAFVISINTMSKWYKLYAESQNHPQLEAYACMPYDFFEHLGIGAVIFDEVHQHLHAVYRAFCYMHVPKSISLSATLLSKDPTISKVQSMMFPHFKRFDKMELRRYVTCHACAYQISNFATTGIQTTEWGQQTYSHVAFERSLLSKKGRHLGEQYMKMISDLVQVAYIEPKVDGDKLAIFVSSKDMAEKLVEHLRGLYPSLDIRTYLMENEYKDVIEPDIRVTTILSAGTAIDIPNLRVSIMTISIDSPVANLQTFGRLREMKHRTEDNDVHFYYLYCTTIPKHVEYHENKLKLLANRVVEQKREFIGTIYPR